MAAALKASSFLQLKQKPQSSSFLYPTSQRIALPSSNNIKYKSRSRSFQTPMASALTAVPTVGLSETFSNLRQNGKVCSIVFFALLSNLGVFFKKKFKV